MATVNPGFDNATRRLIHAVAHDHLPPSALNDPVMLHQATMLMNWDSTEPQTFIDIAQHPDVARGTVLMLYWRSGPGYYQQFATAADVPDHGREGFETGERLAEIYATRQDFRDGIAFDPHDDDGLDSTAEYANEPRLRPIPDLMLQPVAGANYAWPESIDVLSREPTQAERAVIAAALARGRAALPGLPAVASPRDVVIAIAGAMAASGPSTPDDLGWLWLDQVGWPWLCADSVTDGVLFGIFRNGMQLYAPDIVRRTVSAGLDPALTVEFFDLLARHPEQGVDHGFWTEADGPFSHGWLVSTI